MRALVISDIHSNLEAFRAVLAAAPRHNFAWNLGDLVGYGCSPNEVVDLARSLGGVVVRGNHDRACSGSMHFKEYRELGQLAAHSSERTQQVLTEQNRQWLSKLRQGPIRTIPRKVVCAHGSPWNEDTYIFFRDDALAAFRSCRARVICCGHTHWQVGWSWNGKEVTPLKPEFESKAGACEFRLHLDNRNRYILNPGSVGQPRDGDWRAAFAVYDDVEATLTWHRVPYTVKTPPIMDEMRPDTAQMELGRKFMVDRRNALRELAERGTEHGETEE
jgi:diadenosine tetraphosphatase ApaH/serine/threonine PP2A family protein phosphatase